jgi:hypothetical protein
MARVANQPRKQIDELSAEVLEYQVIKGQVDDLEKRKKSLRDSLMETVKILGEPDDRGHLWMPLDTEIGGVSAVVAERRSSPSLNEERALEILEERGLIDRCTKMVRQVDHDEVMACLYDEELSDADVDEMFDISVTWALKLK